MHEKVLPKGALDLLKKLDQNPKNLQGWILAGGTGLALHVGHRISEDLDFFRNDPLDLSTLRRTLTALGPHEILQEMEHALTLLLKNVKISFFIIPDPFIFDPTPYRSFSIADVRDTALMKFLAISSRGSRKDFVDLYTILRGGPTLNDYFNLLPKKYAQGRANAYHILRSLTYFEDAEKEPLPKMLEPFNWKECKNFFIREAHAIILPPP